MELIDLLGQTRVPREDTVGQEAKPFIFNKALLLDSPKMRIIPLTAFVSTGSTGF
jgi:hypothetical protein